MQAVLNDFLSQVRNLALQSKLSPSVRKFYLNIINNAYESSGWSGMVYVNKALKTKKTVSRLSLRQLLTVFCLKIRELVRVI